MRRSLVWAAVALVAAAAWAAAAGPTAKTVDFDALTAALDAPGPHLLIDTRMAESYANGHLPTAVSLPGHLFDRDEIPGLPSDRGLPLIVYCSGGHCGIASYVGERLLDLGYDKVLVYEDGVEGWLKSGQRLVDRRHESLPRVGPDDLGALLAAGAPLRLVDARNADEFARGAPAGAQNVPTENCRPGAPGLPPSPDQAIVVFGQSSWDGRAYVVAERLRGFGYKDVRLYAPGLKGWPRGAGKSPAGSAGAP